MKIPFVNPGRIRNLAKEWHRRAPLWGAVALSLCLFLGCAGPGRHVDRAMPDEAGGLELWAAADAYFGQGNHYRALRYALKAAQADPEDLRTAFLLALIYDITLDRPDLAIPEYRRLPPLRPWGNLPERVQRRLHHLFRISEERRAREALAAGAPGPLSSSDLAVYPMAAAGPRAPHPYLGLALIDVLLFDLLSSSDGLEVDPLRTHVLVHAFDRACPDADAADFARWGGAGRTLTGVLVDLGSGRIRATLQILDGKGEVIYRGPPVTGDLEVVRLFTRALLAEAAEGLGLKLRMALPRAPLDSALGLLLHGEGLYQYLSGQVDQAHSHYRELLDLAPRSTLVHRTYEWADLDLKGSDEAQSLARTYAHIASHPYP
jgi:tetratricopeptide (TPR) repeat protein